MKRDGKEHVSETFRRLLALYRRPDGTEWGGQDLENATGGSVTRSYVSNLKGGRIENLGLVKLEAISRATGFPPALWFGDAEGEGRPTDDALLAALEDETLRSILGEATRLRPKDRRLLLGIARQISPHPAEGQGARPWREESRASTGIQHAILNMPNVHDIGPLETFGREIIPAVADL